MISVKRFSYFFVWAIMIGLIFYLGMKWGLRLEQTASSEFKVFPVVLFSVVFPVVMGVLLRIPQFILSIRGNNRWTFDWPKFTAVGLPTLLILIWYLTSFVGAVPILHVFLIGGSTLPTIVGIIFGYILIDSFKQTEASDGPYT